MVALWFVTLLTQTGHGQGTPALEFFKNYFVTGGYMAAGTGAMVGTGAADGLASAVITLPTPAAGGAPAGAEALAAFLYFQIVSSDGPDAASLTATFNGQPLSTPPDLLPTQLEEGPLSIVGDPEGATPCWSSGGGTGQSGGSKKTYTFRTDVLRFLDIDDNPASPSYGRHRISGDYPVQLPGGANTNAPSGLGATLVVIYRDPNPAAKLNAVVVYDGSWAMDNVTKGMSQQIQGFYDPAAITGKITHIVGSGQENKSELLQVPGSSYANPFTSAWTTFTATTAPLNGAVSFTTSVSPAASNFDCLTWGAVIYQTQVNDSDDDGLLDRWESAAGLPGGVSYPLSDPHGHVLPNLAALNASKTTKDLFVEIASMSTGSAYGVAHSHVPTHAALKKVGDAFAAQGINAHFDLGPGYPAGSADAYIVRSRGGESFDESVTQCIPPTGAAPWVCQFSAYPGTVGWKSGYRYLRDLPSSLLLSNGTISASTDAAYDACEAAEEDADPSTTCDRIFDRNRKDMFHFVLFAHSIGVPKEDCLIDDPASPDFGFPDTACQDTNADFHAPATNTGVGDFPGGDTMVTLGAFKNPAGLPVGSDYMQAATLMHELGHNFHLRHGAAISGGLVVPEPNCKPNYLSVMNYLFQLRGLLGDDGVPQVNYSGQTLNTLDESALLSQAGLWGTPDLAPPAYRTGWYAPVASVPFGTAATRHCDGSPLNGDPSMARVDSASVGETQAQILWDYNNDGTQATQDINFDGAPNVLPSTGPLHGFNDWANLRLNQVGSRRNVGAWFWAVDPTTGGPAAYFGPLSLDAGRGDLGRGDLGRGDLGRGDLGRGDLGRGDLGRGDLGRGDLGRGDLGRGDLGRGDLGDGLGRGDLGRGDLGRGDLGDGAAFELDASIVAANGFAPPNALTGVVNRNDVTLTWAPTNIVTETSYAIYRYTQGASPGSAVQVAGSPGNPINVVAGRVSYTFTESLVPPGAYTYVVVAQFAGGTAPAFVSVTVTHPLPYTVIVEPLKTPAKLGSAVPVKFSVTLGTTIISNISVVRDVRSLRYNVSADGKSCTNVVAASQPVDPVLYSPATGAKGGSNLRFLTSPPVFQFNWDTRVGVAGAGCYGVLIQINDDPTPSTAVQLK